MLTQCHWTVKVAAPKSKEQMLDTKASAYLYGDVYRICYANSKQRYYFEIPGLEYTTEELIKSADEHFQANRQSLDVAKCIRCSKWHVTSGQFCDRCKVAIETYDTNGSGSVELEVEL